MDSGKKMCSEKKAAPLQERLFIFKLTHLNPPSLTRKESTRRGDFSSFIIHRKFKKTQLLTPLSKALCVSERGRGVFLFLTPLPPRPCLSQRLRVAEDTEEL